MLARGEGEPALAAAQAAQATGAIIAEVEAAIQAALHPAAGNWLYFVTVNPKTRQTVFTSSPAEFNRLRQELQHNLGQGG